MGDRSAIQWTSATWNPIYGCTRVSAGCQHCYAERTVVRFQAQFGGDLVRGGPHGPLWTGKVALAEHRLRLPLTWREPRRIFVASLSDPFHEAVPDEWLDKMFAVMALAPRHTFQLLTKRPERMRDYCSTVTLSRLLAASQGMPADDVAVSWPLGNVWLGTSVEEQETANERIPLLLETPAAVRFVSCEPMLGPVNLGHLPIGGERSYLAYDALEGKRRDAFLARDPDCERLGWVIVGGESGPHARPCDLAWIESLVEQCRRAATPCFVKQLGAAPGRHGSRGFTLLRAEGKEGDPDRWPTWLRVREFPGIGGRETA